MSAEPRSGGEAEPSGFAPCTAQRPAATAARLHLQQANDIARLEGQVSREARATAFHGKKPAAREAVADDAGSDQASPRRAKPNIVVGRPHCCDGARAKGVGDLLTAMRQHAHDYMQGLHAIAFLFGLLASLSAPNHPTHTLF